MRIPPNELRSLCMMIVIICSVLQTGCGYMIGAPPVQGIQTVHVPIFKSDSYRRNLDYLLTEAVQSEIKTRTPYRLTEAEIADTLLVGRIIDIRKTPLSENRFDDPREIQLLVGAEVKWIERSTGKILQQYVFPVGPELLKHSSQVSFAPEAGHSLATAQQESARRLVSQIVDLMEVTW